MSMLVSRCMNFWRFTCKLVLQMACVVGLSSTFNKKKPITRWLRPVFRQIPSGKMPSRWGFLSILLLVSIFPLCLGDGSSRLSFLLFIFLLPVFSHVFRHVLSLRSLCSASNHVLWKKPDPSIGPIRSNCAYGWSFYCNWKEIFALAHDCQQFSFDAYLHTPYHLGVYVLIHVHVHNFCAVETGRHIWFTDATLALLPWAGHPRKSSYGYVHNDNT